MRTRRSNFPDIFVARRYGDFRTLATEVRTTLQYDLYCPNLTLQLQKAHPDEQIRAPPAKDRTIVNVPLNSTPSLVSRQFSSWDEPGSPDSPTPPQPNLAPSRLAREKNRLTLRSYLHSLLSSSTIASSPVLRSFLLSGPISLTQEESEDVQRREEADMVRDDGRKRFAKEIASRVDGLRDAVRSVKGDIMGKGDRLLTSFFGFCVLRDILQSLRWLDSRIRNDQGNAGRAQPA